MSSFVELWLNKLDYSFIQMWPSDDHFGGKSMVRQTWAPSL